MNNTRERQVYIAAVIYTLSLFMGGNSIGATSFFFIYSFFPLQGWPMRIWLNYIFGYCL